MFFLLVCFSIFICLDIWWLCRMNALLRRHGMKRLQWFVRGFIVLAILCLTWMIIPINYTGSQKVLPSFVPALVYIWHIMVLPITALLLATGLSLQAVVRGCRWVKAWWLGRDKEESRAPGEGFSRRQFLLSAGVTSVALLPPTAAAGLAGVSLGQIGHFAIQPYSLALVKWPRELDGYTIAVVADVHVGPFSNDHMLSEIIRQTNGLKPDLIVMPGDLINLSLDELPSALDMVQQLHAPDGVYMIQGNHDIVEDGRKFSAMCFHRGVKLLLDDVVTIHPAAGGPAFQLLGIRYVKDQTDDFPSVAKVANHPNRDRKLFPILLAHHPHAWDQARKHQLPLTLAGHTHGGQIMFTKNFGGGPLRGFRYWTGIHDDPVNQSKLVISNGVGNWFPLRYNAPEQILHLTLRSQALA